MKYGIIALFPISWLSMQAQLPLKYDENQTPTYDEVVKMYEQLDLSHPNATLKEFGPTDSGKNLHVFFMGPSALDALPDRNYLHDKVVILINNGIHPGESCGIDASLQFAEDLLKKGTTKNVVYAIIPIYNIGGSLNRGGYSRANQQGPEEHGFRGNARNLDLNRDFIKADALNTLSFYAVFQALQPHIFIDTHTSNGADYQYTITLISTQKDKLNPALSELLTKDMEPYLYQKMEKKGWEMTPYVNVFGYTPDKGFTAFLETPRYASGYTALFNTIGFNTETHMLKTYRDRAKSTLCFLEVINTYSEKNYQAIISAKQKAEEYDRQQNEFALNWKVDSSNYATRQFKGYEYQYLPSKLGGGRG